MTRRNRPSRQRVMAAALLAATWLVGCGGTIGGAPTAVTLPPMPAFELEALDGRRFSSAKLAGKVALVDLWATWCQPCLAEIPHWNQLQKRYSERGFTVLGVTIQSGWASDIRADMETFEFRIAYPVLVGTDEVEQAFGGVLGFPTAFLITREGKIYQKYTGRYPGKQEEIEAAIQKLLAEKL